MLKADEKSYLSKDKLKFFAGWGPKGLQIQMAVSKTQKRPGNNQQAIISPPELQASTSYCLKLIALK